MGIMVSEIVVGVLFAGGNRNIDGKINKVVNMKMIKTLP